MAAVCDLVCDEDIYMRNGEYKLLCTVLFIGWGPKDYPVYIGITKKIYLFLSQVFLLNVTNNHFLILI